MIQMKIICTIVFVAVLTAGFASGEDKTLKITSILAKPYLTYSEDGSVRDGNDSFQGFTKDLSAKIAEKLNVDYEINLVKDAKYGAVDEDGDWDGMIGEIIRGEADVAIAALTITSRRAEDVDFSQPVLFNGLAMLMQKSIASYIQGWDDLSRAGDAHPVVIAGGSTMNFLKNSKEAVFERIWHKCVSSSSCLVNTNEEGVRRVRESEESVYILESTTAEYITQRKPCDLTSVGTLESSGYGIATPKGSPYTEKINLAVLELRESGELRKLKKKWWYDLGECGQTWRKSIIVSSAEKNRWHLGLRFCSVGTVILVFLFNTFD